MAALSTPQKILAALIFLVIVFFSLFRITESPPFGFDEGWAVQVATNIAHSGADGLQFSPGNIQHVSVLTSVGYPLIYALAFWFRLFGAGILQARLLMALYMLGFALVSFALIRRLFGNAIALASLALLATFPPFYSFGKAVIGEVPVLFFLALFLLLFNQAIKSPERKRFWLITAGAAAGLCVITKTMALAFAPVLIIGAILAWKKGLVTFREIGIVVASAIIPVVVWIITNFQPGDSLASIAGYYSNPSALTDKAATFWLNLRLLFTTIGSLYVLALLAAWILGAITRLKARVRITAEEWITLIFSLLLLFSLLFRYFDARYLFPIQVLGLLFFPYSLCCILRALPVPKKNAIQHFVIAALCAASLYQLAFNSYVADSYKSTYQEDLSRYFSSIPPSSTVFLYNSPQVVPLLKSGNYYQRFAIFEKWILGAEFAPMAAAGRIDVLVLNGPMSKADEKIPLDDFIEAAKFSKIVVLTRKPE